MTAIIKTWPASIPARRTLEVFTHEWGNFYFTMGRGKPKQQVDQIYFTYRGRILGYFDVKEIAQNVGQLPKLHSLSGEVSEWQIKPNHWVAICPSPIHRLNEKLYMTGFRGFRYFDIDKYRGTMDARIQI